MENKCLYNAIRDLKSLAKGRIEPGLIDSKGILARNLSSEPLQLMCYMDFTVLFLVSRIHLD